MKTLKKIYYVPGLISAILIPLVFWYLGNQKFEEINLSVIEIALPSKLDINKKWTYLNSMEAYRNWNYKKITVKPSTARANSKFYISEIKKLKQRNQKETGIEFVIKNENSYDDLISIITNLNISKQEMWTLDLNKTGHLYVLTKFKDPSKIERGSDVVYNDNINGNYKASDYFTGYKKFAFQLTQLPKQPIYIIFGYLILLNMSALSLIKRQI